MTTQIQRRRGTTVQHSSFTGAEAEITIDTDKETVVVHDGSQAGGFPLLRAEGGAQNISTSGDITVNTDALFVDASAKNVGIGTSSPTNLLDLSNSTNAYIQQTRGSNVFILGPAGDQAADGVLLRTSSNGPLRFDTNGSNERMRIDSSGNVGIGTTSPGSYAAGGRNLVLASGGDTGLTIKTGATDEANILFASAENATSNNGIIKYNQSTKEMRFQNYGGGNEFFTFYGQGSERLRIDSSGNVGIGTSSPGASLHITKQSAGSLGPEVRLTNNGGSASDKGRLSFYSGTSAPTVRGALDFNIALGGIAELIFSSGDGNSLTERMKIDNSGGVTIAGALSKGSGSFKISHPLPEKTETHNLVHSFIEGPQADLIYSGMVTLVSGKAEINLDTAARMTEGTFLLLNTNLRRFVSNEGGWTAVRSSITGNVLTVEAQDDTCTDEVFWTVIGERKDQHMIDTSWTDENGRVITEPLKKTKVAALEAT